MGLTSSTPTPQEPNHDIQVSGQLLSVSPIQTIPPPNSTHEPVKKPDDKKPTYPPKARTT